jgi:D-aminopeptidase
MADGDDQRSYTLGVLCQTNYGHLRDLVIGGMPIGRILQDERNRGTMQTGDTEDVHVSGQAQPFGGRTKDGSILVAIITDAPLATHQLNRVARHATVGLTKVGGYGVGRTFSGDIFLALSTADQGPEQLEGSSLGDPATRPAQIYQSATVKNECIDPFFYACAEAVEEAILNSLCGGAGGTVAMDGAGIEGFPVQRIRELLDQYLVKI